MTIVFKAWWNFMNGNANDTVNVKIFYFLKIAVNLK